MGKRTSGKTQALRGAPPHGSAGQNRKRPSRTPPPFTIRQILAWADAYHRRTGKWPGQTSGPVAESPRENWHRIEHALRRGYRGLPGGSSLAMLLAERRGARNRRTLPTLSTAQILQWADAHHDNTGRWPNTASGPVDGALGQTWAAINTALHTGGRGLRGGTSLGTLLAKRRHAPQGLRRAALTVTSILAWADEHHRRTGKWPTNQSGPVRGIPGLTWCAIDLALLRGMRGLAGGSSLHQLFVGHRGVRNKHRAALTTEQILAWAEVHRRRIGAWPSLNSGEVRGAPGETWRAIDRALRRGLRGLHGGSSLHRLLTLRPKAKKAPRAR